MKEQAIEDILRDAASQAEHPVSAQLWDRVASGLDQAGHSAAPAPPRSMATSTTLSVVHRAQRTRYLRLASIAASLLLVCGLGWQMLDNGSQPASPAGLSESLSPSDFDRKSLEGTIEIDAAPGSTLSRSLYEGVVVKTGEGDISALRVCGAC